MIKALKGLTMDYITTKEAAKNWGIADRMAVYHSSAGQIKGSKKTGNTWLVPVAAEKPTDRRYRSSKAKDGENK